MNDFGDLFDWVVKKVTNVRSTSKEAYAELKDEGILGRQEKEILDAMEEGWNYSLREIEKITEIQINAVSGRVNGLKKKGFVVECEKRRCALTGRMITPVMKVV